MSAPLFRATSFLCFILFLLRRLLFFLGSAWAQLSSRLPSCTRPLLFFFSARVDSFLLPDDLCVRFYSLLFCCSLILEALRLRSWREPRGFSSSCFASLQMARLRVFKGELGWTNEIARWFRAFPLFVVVSLLHGFAAILQPKWALLGALRGLECVVHHC